MGDPGGPDGTEDADGADDPGDLDLPGDREGLLEALRARLAATEELPVDPGAGHWLGEAQAVVEDARGAPPGAVDTRVRQARDLLESVDGTGNPRADEHVAAARAIAARLLEELG